MRRVWGVKTLLQARYPSFLSLHGDKGLRSAAYQWYTRRWERRKREPGPKCPVRTGLPPGVFLHPEKFYHFDLYHPTLSSGLTTLQQCPPYSHGMNDLWTGQTSTHSSSAVSDHLEWLKYPAILIMQILLIESFKFKSHTTLVFNSATGARMCLFYFVSLSRSTDLNCFISEDYEGRKNQIYRWLASVVLQC